MPPKTRQQRATLDQKTEQKAPPKRSNARNTVTDPAAKRRKMTTKNAQKQIKDNINQLLFSMDNDLPMTNNTNVKADGVQLGLSDEVKTVFKEIEGNKGLFKDAYKILDILKVSAVEYQTVSSQQTGIEEREKPRWQQDKEELMALNHYMFCLASQRTKEKIIPGSAHQRPPQAVDDVEMLAWEIFADDDHTSHVVQQKSSWGELIEKTFRAFEGILGSKIQ